ncbi:DNA-binding transcriptional regulator MelR [Pelagimonas phthalicica]|uniref:DNA-binding transcriptional regulator MelR n=1 Tax=Pelagimonas phthalicica TaxID=1037362 RepID=A0A238JHR6_9RHOB|nr:helix-turn-helix transcriptional regulator [Pelagimonas phthalicica]TDS90042.1 AraC family transcriptional regulator [Pelagimonas phthalicica]SMX30210.1 DNA-binding transcriptional regulator MelR [Pelagimonas phthalicica]
MTFASIETALTLATAGFCLFCANLLLLRRRDAWVYVPLALLFLFKGLASGALLWAESEGAPDFALRLALLVGGFEVASPFLFWLYVRGLTSEGELERVPRLRRHILPIVFVVLCFWSALFMPADLVNAEIAEDDPRMPGLLLIALLVLVADLSFKVMIGIYIYLTIRRLTTYQARLKEVFASTENKELTWIWVIMLSAGLYLLVNILHSASIWAGALSAADFEAEALALNSLVLFALFWVLGIWGLRQRPGLIQSHTDDRLPPEEPAKPKYEKSALDETRAQRIAEKIEAAMSEDLLYRNPNLSLWDLAKHVGVNSHYLSQTLNAHLDKNFFDLVNGYRIQDAIKQLTQTEETILVIAYDVGFNSRSAFYKAFKRETGKTPSDLRK